MTRFVRDGERVLVETDAGGTTQARYTVAAGGWFDRLLSLRRSGASRFYHLDALGSAVRLTDASQSVTDSYVHKAFGVLVTSTGNTVNPFRFVAACGYYRDPSTGLMQLGLRYYRDGVGRFVSRDPLCGRPGLRLLRYGCCGYAGGRATTASDPSGLLVTCKIMSRPQCKVGRSRSRIRGKLSWLTLAFEWLNALVLQSLFDAFPDLPIPLPEVRESG